MPKLIANNGDPDQMPCSAASDVGLHCLPITSLGVSRPWVEEEEWDGFWNISVKKYVVGAEKFLSEVHLMSTHSMCFQEELRIITKYSDISELIYCLQTSP